ncbi:sensor histidine kinase [Salinarimonas ramus]|uniref:histidine kinase n=1 Tax=Salinarimonas ramus TaxID=690164 RepID=A0A917QGB8_9HYPH|nr:HAMP domain-containing sensor histidine kinase [Salinarimonas ramus]GGK49284.1 two-component sensor histidine kinase [Salinarimonas ramus]
MADGAGHNERREAESVAGDVKHRRRVAQDVRAAREKLTSSTGLERAFETELVRLFAQYRVGAAIPLYVLAAAIAGAATTWLPIVTVAVWAALTLLAMTIMVVLARNFLRASEDDARTLGVWRRLFAMGEMLHGAAWAYLLQLLAQVPSEDMRIFVLFCSVMITAVVATLSATVPAAVYAGLAPILVVVGLATVTSGASQALMLAMMIASAQVFFVLLARHLYGSAVATLLSRAEKDALFVELEQAKANSDEARRRAEEANLAKSRFLATMSHELRTPLNAILGFSEVMKGEVFGPHASDSYREYSADIHASGQHLLNLINEILDLSRIEAGRYELNEEAIALAHVIDDCAHMMNLRAKAKGQVIRTHVDESLPRIWADERAIRQVVLNILSNAIKFTPQGGEITIKVGWTSSGGQYVAVKDTGPGIPEEEIPVVMSSFGRGTWAIKTAEQGSGLGLPIVKGLVDLHGGGFQLRSKPREGTEVIVTLPANRVMNALPPVAQEKKSAA